MKNKIVKLESLKKLIDQLRKKNKKIVHCHECLILFTLDI